MGDIELECQDRDYYRFKTPHGRLCIMKSTATTCGDSYEFDSNCILRFKGTLVDIRGLKKRML
jgi:hypothetical protein